MHESSLMKGLIRKLEQIAVDEGAQHIAVVRVRLGALSHFSEAHFIDHFVEAARGGCAEGARLEIELGSDPREPGAQEVWLKSVDLAWDPACDSEFACDSASARDAEVASVGESASGSASDPDA